MHLTTHTDAETFLRDVQADLELQEAEHSLILGAALANPQAPTYAATVRDRQGLVLAAFQAASYPLLLASDRVDVHAAVALLVEEWVRAEASISAVVAPDRIADTFAEQWSHASGLSASVGMRQRLHALPAVQPISPVPGHLRAAGSADLDLIADWMAAFDQEALGAGSLHHAREVAQRRVDAGEMYLWADLEPRTMAGRARPTRGTVAVNAVYTPHEFRSHGYATATVAALSTRLLAEGRSCCVLFTDLANPTSNSIYARIGYEPLLDFTLWRFTREAMNT